MTGFLRLILLISLLIVTDPSMDASEARPLLHPLFTDHAVLQRDRPVTIWGWAEPGTKVTVRFAGQTQKTSAGPDGKWACSLDPLAASSEGRRLEVETDKTDLTAVANAVLVGDVWLCSGQSNMEMGITLCKEDEEIAQTNFPGKTVATNFVPGSSGGDLPGALARAATHGTASLKFDVPGSTVVARTGFEAWAAGHGIPANETNDDDHDGISALLEYALGYDPTVGNLLPALQAAGPTYQITWPKGSQAAADPNIAYGVEVSPDSVQWNTSIPADLFENATGMALTLPADRQQFFARLRVTRTAP
jgi:hypothetical protein